MPKHRKSARHRHLAKRQRPRDDDGYRLRWWLPKERNREQELDLTQAERLRAQRQEADG